MPKLTLWIQFLFNSTLLHVPDIKPLLEFSLYPLEQNGDICNFSAILNLTMSNMRDQYFISVSPPPPYGPANWTINGSTTSLNLRNNTVYNMTISTCPYGMATSHFTIGMIALNQKSVFESL